MNAIEAALAKPDNTEFAIAMSDLLFARHEAVGFAGMSEAEQTAYCLDCLEREVNNGGFDQFFVNSSGDTSLETITALDRLGAHHTADLVRRAVAVFPNGDPSSDRDVRWTRSRAFGLQPKSSGRAWTPASMSIATTSLNCCGTTCWRTGSSLKHMPPNPRLQRTALRAAAEPPGR